MERKCSGEGEVRGTHQSRPGIVEEFNGNMHAAAAVVLALLLL